MNRREPISLGRTLLAGTLLASALIGVLSGCAQAEVVRLWTDNASIAPYVEHYNSLSREHRVELLYRRDPQVELARAAEMPDLVIDSFLTGERTRAFFRPIRESVYAGSGVYAQLLALGRIDDRQLLLPLAFDLPLIEYRPEYLETEMEPFAVELGRLRELGAEYNAQNGGRLIRMGFSPRVYPGFSYVLTQSLGADFHEAGGETIVWNAQRLEQSILELAAWAEEANGGIEQVSSFETRYLYDPANQILEAGRMLFAYTRASDYFSRDEGVRGETDFRWPVSGGRITVSDDVLFGGIPREAENPDGAAAFLSWILEAETQEELLNEKRQKRIATFGFAGGFSSLRQVNEDILIQLYPDLLGAVVPAAALAVPSSLPHYWPRLRDEVLEPWLLAESRRVIDTGPPTDSAELEIAIRAWRDRNGF
jgi:hypothetical protein